METTIREVTTKVLAHTTREGAGFTVRRPLPAPGFAQADPFLLLDELGPVSYAKGQAKGAPDHPHRGFETVTYVLEGETEHRDSAGHHGLIGPGDVQWMTAGAGIVHSEMPSQRMQREGGRVHGFQIWVNLPRKLKMTAPRYQEVPSAKIPDARSEDGKAHVRVIAGQALGASAVIDTHTPIALHDWTLSPGADITVGLDPALRAYLYVFQASVRAGDQGTSISDGHLAILSEGNAIRLRADEPARLLLLAGAPLREPVARYGPFVMNAPEEIEQAIWDYQQGKMGQIAHA